MRIDYQLLTDLDIELNQFLLNDTRSLFYQSENYLKLLQAYLVCDMFIFICRENEGILAVFPLAVKRNSIYGNVANSLPFYGSNGSFVFNESVSSAKRNEIRHLFNWKLNEFLNVEEIGAFTFVCSPFQMEDSDWFEKNLSYTHTDSRIGQVTKLPVYSGSIEADLLQCFDNPRPRNIRRALKAEIIVEKQYNQESLNFLYSTHKQNIEAIGGKAKDKSFFDAIPFNFTRDDYAIYVAYKGTQPIAALLLFYFNKTVEYFTPATIHEFRNDQPSALLIFEAMKDAAFLGYEHWNWGGTWKSQEGVYDFKRKWGAEDFEYQYFTRVVNSRLLNEDIKELSTAFPYFYLFPY